MFAVLESGVFLRYLIPVGRLLAGVGAWLALRAGFVHRAPSGAVRAG